MIAESVADGIFRVKVPVPLPLKYVNCYLLYGANGWTIVDTGMHYDPAEACWLAAFDQLGIGWRDIATIVVTHYHPDHFGSAGWMQQQSGAPVLMSPIEIDCVQRLWMRPQNEIGAATLAMFCQHGMPQADADAIWRHIVEQGDLVAPLPETLTPINMNQLLKLGERTWQPIHAPGHADGQVCLYDQADRLLLVADHVLPTITPNVSVWPESRPDPLSDYLDSLPKIAELDVRLALPGHRSMITNFRDRCDEIIAHHHERLDAMQRLAGDGATAYEICLGSFALDQLTPHQIRFAMAETLAHMVYLEKLERVQRHERAGQIVFVDLT